MLLRRLSGSNVRFGSTETFHSTPKQLFAQVRLEGARTKPRRLLPAADSELRGALGLPGSLRFGP